MEPVLRECSQCLNMFEPKSEGETLCDKCLDTEVTIGIDMASGPDHHVETAIEKPERNRLKVLSFSTLHFLLPDDFEGGLGDALRAMADYHDSVQRGETKDPPLLVKEPENRSGSQEEHEPTSWELFHEALERNLRVSGTVCITDFVRGKDGEWESKYMDLVDGERSDESVSEKSIIEQTFVIEHIKADEPTINLRVYPANVLQASADQATQKIRDAPLAIVHIPEKDFEKPAAETAMEFDKVGLVRQVRFDGEHLVARGIPMVGKAFEEGARLLPVMECKVHLSGKLTIVDEATIVRFDLLPAKDKD